MTGLARISTAIRRFAADEHGSATVDFVVGTAAAISVTLAMTGQVKTAVMTLADGIADNLVNIQIVTTFDLQAGSATNPSAD